MSRTSQTITWVIVAAVIIIGGIYFFSLPADEVNVSYNTAQEDQTQNRPVVAEGRVVLSVTDAAVNMGSISEVDLTISRADLRSPTDGWVNVSNAPQTFSLLNLNKNKQSMILTDAQIKEGTYDKVRLTVDNVTLKMKDGSMKTAKLPSGQITIDISVVVVAGQTTSVSFDFIANKSLHLTGNGKYIFAPVINTESKSNSNVTVDANNIVSIGGGDVKDSKSVGMDVDGTIKPNFQMDNKLKLEIDSNDSIKLNNVVIIPIPVTN